MPKTKAIRDFIGRIWSIGQSSQKGLYPRVNEPEETAGGFVNLTPYGILWMFRKLRSLFS